jgi:hypothetical protein
VEGEWDRRQIPHFYIKLRLACRYKETACTPSLSLESAEKLERRARSNKNTGLVARAQWQWRSLYFSITVNLAGTSRSSLALCVLPNEVEMSKTNARGVLLRQRATPPLISRQHARYLSADNEACSEFLE